MRPSQSRSFLYVTTGALAFLALRPVEPLERAFDLLLSPTRLLAELAGPLGWLQSRDVHAADPDQRALRLAELEAHRALERAVLEMAQPSDAGLLHSLDEHGISSVRAEVVERPTERDRVVVRLEDPTFVRHGLPVVCGDSLVGLVDLETPLDPRRAPDEVEVRLLTGRDARIGARVASDQEGQLCDLVVGGITPARDVRLDVHNPSNRRTQEGIARVLEPAERGEGYGHLANGFLLGRLSLDPVVSGLRHAIADRTVLGVAPEVDFDTGLYQLLVLLPPGVETRREPGRPSQLEDGHWLEARLAVRGEPSPWRRGRKLRAGLREGVEPGAALASGVRFVGRVTRVAWASSDVRLFADPGFRIPALAMVDGRPLVLGEIETLGGSGARVRVRWSATLELPSAEERPATLWTGSGAVGVPRGLLLGETVLPQGPGPHELVVELPDHGSEPARTFVRWEVAPE